MQLTQTTESLSLYLNRTTQHYALIRTVRLGHRYWLLLGLLAISLPVVQAPAETVVGVWTNRYNAVTEASAVANKCVSDADGNVIVSGDCDAGITQGDILTIKYSANGVPIWTNRYNGPANDDDSVAAVAVDGSGNVVITGYSSNTNGYADYYTAKYAAGDGALLWEKRYNGPANRNDKAQAVAVDGSGNVVVTGESYNANFVSDYYTAKYAAADGALLWEKRYNGPANDDDSAAAIAVDGSGNVVVTGYSVGSGGNYDYYTAKYAAADGALLWEKRYNGPANDDDSAAAVKVDGSGNVVVAGSSSNGGNSDYYTAKYAAGDGALLWEKRYNGLANESDFASAVAVDGSGNVVVTGYSYNGSNFDYYTAKYAAGDGTLLWEQRYNSPANFNDYLQAVAVDGSGNVVVTGESHNGVSDNPSSDYYTAKYAAADGTLLWERRYNGPANASDYVQDVTVDGNGNMVVTGYSYNGSNYDYYTAKYAAADGVLLWEQRYNTPANRADSAVAVAVDGSGNVVVTGYSYNNGNFSSYADYYTAKYAAADGILLWEKRYNGPANDFDSASAVAVDGSGNVVVTGYSVGSGGNYDYYTAKYAAADGTLLWENRYNGPANLNDMAHAVTVDGSGNVVVTGESWNANYVSDYYTAKYAAADGALLWEKRYNGPANEPDSASAVAVDGSGNVVVAGYSSNASNPDYYTAKYAAADGSLLWEKRYNGAANSYDYIHAVAVDGSGNVVVTGYSNSDYYTAKYAAADGSLLWEKRYNGPANDSDSASAVAVDGSGNVVVTGYSIGIGGYYDYYTAKYAATDGALLWEKRYSGLANREDKAQAVTVDGSGNVVVTGESLNANYTSDYYTAKYAAADGTLLWEQRYNGPANGNDLIKSRFALAITPFGGVVVTGASDADYSYYGDIPDYATILYLSLPGIIIQPTNQTVAPGGTATFIVTALGMPLTYQWLFNQVPIPGATNSSLTLTNVTLAHVGNYQVVITNASGSVTSSVATLNLSQPAGYFRLQPELGSGATMRLAFLGDPGGQYVLERSLTLDPALWLPQITNTANPSGSVLFTNALNAHPMSFWRVRLAP